MGKEILENVNEIRYLGFMITYNLSNKIDIIRERNRFYGNFNCILRKFYYVDLQIFLTLFNSFCLCFYGTELWFENFNCKTVKKQFAIGYHKAVKKFLQVPWRESNHAVCNALNLLVFDDLINLRSVKFLDSSRFMLLLFLR